MKNYLSVLKKTKLFEDFLDEEILAILDCMSVKITSYQKDEAVLIAGNYLKNIGIVLSGTLKLQREDDKGNVVTIDELKSTDIFGEAFVCAGVKEVPVSIWAMDSSEVLFIDYAKIITTCSSTCAFHTKLIKNMLKIMSVKLISLNKKLDIVQKKTIREKLIAYLETFRQGSNEEYFVIPFNRNELAEYLRVNRSALSRELSQMKEQGLIDFSGNKFCFKNKNN